MKHAPIGMRWHLAAAFCAVIGFVVPTPASAAYLSFIGCPRWSSALSFQMPGPIAAAVEAYKNMSSIPAICKPIAGVTCQPAASGPITFDCEGYKPNNGSCDGTTPVGWQVHGSGPTAAGCGATAPSAEVTRSRAS